LGDALRVTFHLFSRFRLYHDACESLGTAVTHDDPPFALERGLGFLYALAHLWNLFQRLLLSNPHIHDHLREDLQICDKLIQWFARSLHDVEDQQCCKQAIACGAVRREKDVPGLLAAQRGVMLTHHLEHVLIADRCAQHADVAHAECGLEAHVGHGCGDNRVVLERSASLQITRCK